jgi:hypothetical protein
MDIRKVKKLIELLEAFVAGDLVRTGLLDRLEQPL